MRGWMNARRDGLIRVLSTLASLIEILGKFYSPQCEQARGEQNDEKKHREKHEGGWMNLCILRATRWIISIIQV